MYIRKMTELSGNKIFLHLTTVKNLDLNEGDNINLNFGTWNKVVEICYLECLEENILGISKSLMVQFTIPEDIDFEWYRNESNLYIGPVLGIIRGYNFNNINKGSLNILLRWVKDYQNIKGLVIIFPLSEVSEGVQAIKGYYYNPKNQKKWAEGIFPFPSAVFNRPVAGVGNKYRVMENLTEGRFFNSKGTGKWEFFLGLYDNPATRLLVPYTEKYKNFEQLFEMLNKYKVLYLKRRFGARGYGIIQVKKTDYTFEATRVIKGTQEKEKFENESDLKAFLQRLVKKDRYIIQQGIPYETQNHNKVDFRAYLQKDGSKEWRVSGFVGRVAKSNSVITNLRYTEKILPGKMAIRECYNFKENDIDQVENKIKEACILAGKSLDMNLGHFGDIALDFILDSHENVYFLESNSYYGHASLGKIKDCALKSCVFKSPMEYAKALTGFPLRKE